jgi:hypothetical protein
MNTSHRIAAIAGVTAMAVTPVAAFAAPGHGQGNGHGRVAAPGQIKKQNPPTPDVPKPAKPAKGDHIVFKGTIVSATATTLSVKVTSGNKDARTFDGQTVSFTLTGADIVAHPHNGDTVKNQAGDLAMGDRVVVKTTITATGAMQPFAATQVVDQTHVKA